MARLEVTSQHPPGARSVVHHRDPFRAWNSAWHCGQGLPQGSSEPLLTCSTPVFCLGALSPATGSHVRLFPGCGNGQSSCMMTKDLPSIGGPKPLKTLLQFQVKCQEVVMQQNNSSPCGHQTRYQRNPLTKTVAPLATPRFQCGAGICAPQAKKKSLQEDRWW